MKCDTHLNHAVAFSVWFAVVIFLLHIEFAEKVEGQNGVQIYDDQDHHDGEHELKREQRKIKGYIFLT